MGLTGPFREFIYPVFITGVGLNLLQFGFKIRKKDISKTGENATGGMMPMKAHHQPRYSYYYGNDQKMGLVANAINSIILIL